VLSNSARAKGVDTLLKAIEEFARARRSERQWLQGSLGVIDERQVSPSVTPSPKQTDISSVKWIRQLQHAHESGEKNKAKEQAKLRL